MTVIEFVSETPTKHKITFNTPLSFRDKLTAAELKELKGSKTEITEWSEVRIGVFKGKKVA